MYWIVNRLKKAWLPVALVASLTATSQSEEEIDCGPNYPEGLPCIAGGTLVHDEPSAFPGMPGVMVLAYWTELRHLRAGIEKAAEHSDWSVNDWEVGEEPDGKRYRNQLVNGEQVVAVSIYMGKNGWALLQMMDVSDLVKD